jgi:hypothetical protein
LGRIVMYSTGYLYTNMHGVTSWKTSLLTYSYSYLL